MTTTFIDVKIKFATNQIFRIIIDIQEIKLHSGRVVEGFGNLND
jgi:hypothetical protein